MPKNHPLRVSGPPERLAGAVLNPPLLARPIAP